MDQRPFGRGCLIGNDRKLPRSFGAPGRDARRHCSKSWQAARRRQLASPTFLCSTIPTAGSTESSLRSRPPPRITHAVPICSHCMLEMKSALGAHELARCARGCGSRLGSSMTRASPPCNSTICAEFLQRLSRRNQLLAVLLSFGDALRASSEMQHPTRQFETQLSQILRPATAQNLQNFDHLERVADRSFPAADPCR